MVDEAPVTWSDTFAVNSSSSYTVTGDVTWTGGVVKITGHGTGGDYNPAGRVTFRQLGNTGANYAIGAAYNYYPWNVSGAGCNNSRLGLSVFRPG